MGRRNSNCNRWGTLGLNCLNDVVTCFPLYSQIRERDTANSSEVAKWEEEISSLHEELEVRDSDYKKRMAGLEQQYRDQVEKLEKELDATHGELEGLHEQMQDYDQYVAKYHRTTSRVIYLKISPLLYALEQDYNCFVS